MKYLTDYDANECEYVPVRHLAMLIFVQGSEEVETK